MVPLRVPLWDNSVMNPGFVFDVPRCNDYRVSDERGGKPGKGKIVACVLASASGTDYRSIQCVAFHCEQVFLILSAQPYTVPLVTCSRCAPLQPLHTVPPILNSTSEHLVLRPS